MLTPIDIRNRQLKPKMGGYDKKDTDDFLEEIIASYEEMYNENRTLQEKITSLSEGIQYYKKMEGTLQKALVLAEKTSSETQEAAKSQADSMMSEATAKAEAMSREAKAEIDALRAEAQAQAEVTKAKANRELEETRNHVRKLVQSYENYRLQFKKLAEAQIEMLDSESFSIFVPELDELMNEAPSADSVMDNPGIIPINIGSPAPFVAPPEDPQENSPAESAKVEEIPVSISIPVTSSIEPFMSPQDDEEAETVNASSAAPTMDILLHSTPTIDINISSSIGEDAESSPITEKSLTESASDVAGMPAFETPADSPAMEMPSADVPVHFETPADGPAMETPSADVPLHFEMPAENTPEINIPAMENPALDVPPVASPTVEIPVPEMPQMDIPLIDPVSTEIPAAEQQMSTNGLIGSDPVDSMTDTSPFIEPGIDLAQDMPTEPVSAQPSSNGIISDAFLEPENLFDAPMNAVPTQSESEAKTSANDNFIDINPFNFIDPE